MGVPQRRPVARAVPFDNSTNGFTSFEVQSAIEEARTNSIDRYILLASYGGNANSGRFLEFFPGIDSDIAPLSLNISQKCILIDAHATASGTAEVGFYDGATLLYTATFTATSEVVATGSQSSPLFTLSNTANFKIKIISGSLNKPYLTMLFSSSF